jgi:hypothetical protein
MAEAITHFLWRIRDESHAISVVGHRDTLRSNGRGAAMIIEAAEVGGIKVAKNKVDAEAYDMELAEGIIVGKVGAHGHVCETSRAVLVVVVRVSVETKGIRKCCLCAS